MLPSHLAVSENSPAGSWILEGGYGAIWVLLAPDVFLGWASLTETATSHRNGLDWNCRSYLYKVGSVDS